MPEKEKNISRGREDLTTERTPSQRRLDSFAKLLAVNSECVAVSIVNGEIWIAANDLNEKSKSSNTTITSIQEIFSYFQGVANTGNIGSLGERAKLFKMICSKSRLQKKLKAGYSAFNLKDQELEEIAVLVFKSQGQSKISDIAKITGGKVGETSLVYAEFAKLYKHFIKLEEALTQKKAVLSEQEFSVFKSASIRILQEEASVKNGVHAEVQILGSFVKSLLESKLDLTEDKKIYIGISKLCCLNCRCVIEEANRIFNEKGIKTEFLSRGKHDIDFEWNVPGVFKEGYEMVPNADMSKFERFEDLAILIGHASSVSIKKFLEVVPPKHIPMEHSDSQSETEEDREQKIIAEKIKLENIFDFIKSQENNGEIIAKKMSIALEIYKNSVLIKKMLLIRKTMSLNEIGDNLLSEIRNNFEIFLGELNKNKVQETEVSQKELLEVLQNPFLIGEEVAKYFRDFDLKKEASKMEMEHEEKSSDEAILYSREEAEKLRRDPPVAILTGFNDDKKRKEVEEIADKDSRQTEKRLKFMLSDESEFKNKK